jgi:signal recognition particle GTPase
VVITNISNSLEKVEKIITKITKDMVITVMVVRDMSTGTDVGSKNAIFMEFVKGRG